jgi:hypothetical protein
MKTSTAVLIGVGVLVGVPLLLIGVVAYAAKRVLDNALHDPTMLPLSGSANGYRWAIDNTSVTGLWNWEVDTSAGVEVASGAAGTLDGAKESVLSIISGKREAP